MASERGGRRHPLAVYALELSIGSVAGLALFLFLLWLLQGFFPDATGLGELVRARSLGPRGPVPAAADGAGATIAVLSEIRRDVRGKPASSIVWSAAKQGATLGDGDAVQSYAGSGATIQFDEHNALKLGEKSLIVLRRPREQADSGRRRASVLFMDGFLRGRLGGGGAGQVDLEVIAAGATVRPHGPGDPSAEIALALDKESSALAVREGDAEVVWNDRVTVVPSGHMVTFDPAHAPSVPVALPRTPTPLAPPDGESYRYRAAPPRVSFSWRPPDDTSEFTVQIARDPEFAQLVFERTQEGTSFTHGALGAGDYYWRVTGRRGPIASAESRALRFRIEAAQRPPLLRVEFPDGEVAGLSFVLRGETAPGCRVIIGDVAVAPDAHGRFEHPLSLRAGYNFVVVQTIDSLGNTAFESRTIVAESDHPEGNP